MKDYRDVIKRMNELVNRYHKMKELDGHEMALILKDFTSALYYLETVRSDIHHQWQSKVKALIEEGMSVSRSENQAHVEFPEMYELRRLMDSAYEIVGSIRTNISLIKHEQTLGIENN